jgi:hypothetical protein
LGKGAGNVELLSGNSWVSPKKATVYPGNKVSYVLGMNNHYEGNPFYIKTSIDDPGVENSKFTRYTIYPIKPATEDEQVYDLLIAKFTGESGTVYEKFVKEISFTDEVIVDIKIKKCDGTSAYNSNRKF